MKNLNSLSSILSILAIIFISINYNKKEIKKEEISISKDTIAIEKYKNEYDSIYQNTTLPCENCDTITDNYCSSLKLEFAESLLKKCYEKHVEKLEKEREYPGEETISKNMLIELKKSQISWENYKNDVVNYTRYRCEGGTACIEIFNSKNIELVLKRIEELED